MKILFFIMLLSLFLFSNTIEEGKELYLDAKCNKCHLDGKEFDPNSIKKEGLHSKVKTQKDLLKWVTDCNSYFNIGWFPEEEKQVAHYLNAIYYKLDKKTK